MFFENSRYIRSGTYQITTEAGATVSVTRIPLPSAVRPRGYARSIQGPRLDRLSYQFLRDPTAFWRLCDANNAVSPDALAARDLVGIPPM